MPKYIGQSCVSCQEKFTEQDDIVVCPDCGSPYHRECYKKEGKCISEELHTTGEGWKPQFIIPEIPKTVDYNSEHIGENHINDSNEETVGSYHEEYQKKICHVCGNYNDHDDLFCAKCGTRLVSGEKRSEDHKNICPICKLENRTTDVFCVRCGAPLDMEKATSQTAFGGFGYRQRITPESDVDGNTVDDYTRYVGPRFFYFIPKFLNFSKFGSKLSFNLSAFVFPHVYFLYRKMYLPGIITMILNIFLNIPVIITQMAMSQLIPTSVTESETFIMVYYICSVISSVLSIACGLFANWIYYKKAKSDISKIKDTVLESGIQKFEIASKGGTSIVAVLAAFTVSMIAYFAMMWLIASAGIF